MCEDMMDCLKKVHKKAVRTLEHIVEDADEKFTEGEITKVHRLLDIIKDGEKMKILYKEEQNGEE